MSLQNSVARPSLAAVAVGAIFLVVLSLLRARTQPIVDTLPYVAILLSALVFLVPGIVAGAIGGQAAFLNGIILGFIGAAVVTLQSAQFHQPDWSSVLVYETIGVWACIGVPLCVLGAAFGRSLAKRI
jgi:putative membrane protein (TIGR04086 family)